MIDNFSRKYGFDWHNGFLFFGHCWFLNNRLFWSHRYRKIKWLFLCHLKLILVFKRSIYFNGRWHWIDWLLHKWHWSWQLAWYVCCNWRNRLLFLWYCLIFFLFLSTLLNFWACSSKSWISFPILVICWRPILIFHNIA